MKIGIIGGSGLDNPQLLKDYEEKDVETPYGKPSSKIVCGKISNVEVCILARHGRNHEIPPSQVNFRANIYALKSLGCMQILATSAVGSLKEEIAPGDLVFPNQFIDFTKQRMKENAEKVKKLLIKVIPIIANEDLSFLKSKIRTIPNFPKYGIMFRDITTLLSDNEGMEKVMEIFYKKYKDSGIDLIAGVESRGFIIGGMLANKLKVGFVPIRKPGKLPYETIKESYMLEYGSDSVEIHKDAIKPGQKVLLIDDLIATGGTALAAANLVERLGGKIVECAFVIELVELKGKEKLKGKGHSVFSVVSFEGH